MSFIFTSFFFRSLGGRCPKGYGVQTAGALQPRYLVLSPLLQWTVGSYIFRGPSEMEGDEEGGWSQEGSEKWLGYSMLIVCYIGCYRLL